MTRHSSLAALVAAALTLGAAFGSSLTEAEAVDAPAPFALRDGDRIVFYGDSITEEGGYGRLVEAYVASRFPAWDVRFYNSGVGGDRVSGGWAGAIDERLERDVIALRPSVVTVMLGMNDGGYKPYDAATFAAYAAGYRTIVAKLREALPDARLTLIQPSPFDDVARPAQFPAGYDDVLRRYGCYVAALAKREGARVVDFRTPVNAGLAAVQATHPELARQILPDRVHPSDAGHLVMGAALLRAWNAPAVVTRVEVEATEPRVVATERTTVSDLEATDRGLSWTQLDEALPLPLLFEGATVELAEAAGAGLEALDQQPLVVTGLPAGRFDVMIDDQVVGTFSESALSAGVNLATLATPMRRQAFSIRWAAEGRDELRRVLRQMVASGPEAERWESVAADLEAFDEAAQATRREGSQPVPRRYRLVPRQDIQ
ncbi:MAG: SGNH/GDSL hydrolase family protein [Acidobacteria bacterium]|nr:SGNH/GDSL hydrolase family protein [Acidobacteriota bacterium]